jgi:hypothetical protein
LVTGGKIENLAIRLTILLFCAIKNDERFWFPARFQYSIYGIPKIRSLT